MNVVRDEYVLTAMSVAATEMGARFTFLPGGHPHMKLYPQGEEGPWELSYIHGFFNFRGCALECTSVKEAADIVDGLQHNFAGEFAFYPMYLEWAFRSRAISSRHRR